MNIENRKNEFLYFAYGSNMNTKWLKRIGIIPLASSRAKLPNYRMSFDVSFPYSTGLIHGLATITPAQGSVVYGVLHSLKPNARKILDLCEFVFIGLYNRIEVTVELDSGAYCRAEAYIGRYTKPGGTPQSRYRAIILDGARKSNLPLSWINWLEGLDT